MKAKFLLFLKKSFQLWNVGALLLLFCMNLQAIAQPLSQEKFPNFTSDVSNSGSYWTYSDYVKSDDNVYSYNWLSTGISDFLVAYNYKFSIPSGATITGIKVTVGRYGDAGSAIQDDFVKLRKNGAFVGAINKAVSGDWPATETSIEYGGETDLWGTSWTATDINSANFGIGMAVKKTSGSGAARVDYIKIAVYYVPLDLLYCAGAAVELIEAQSVTNPYNSLNMPDGAVTTLLNSSGDIFLDLTGEVTPRPTGGHVTVRWSDGNPSDGGSPLAYYIYTTTYTIGTTPTWSSPVYINVTSPTLVDQDISIGENTRYVMFRISSSTSDKALAIDAVTYDCPCAGPTITSVTASPATICAGESTTLAVTGDLCGAEHWAWYKESCGGTSIGTGTSISYTPDNTGTLTYYVRAEGGSAGTEGTCSEVTVTVNPVLTPSVTIKSDDDDNNICEGTLVTFTATPQNTGGGTVSFQWMYNDHPVGLQQNTYNNNSESENGDRVSCEITVSEGNCLTSSTAISEEITITVFPTGGTATTTTPSICSGKTAVLTLTDYLGSIQWQYTNGSSEPVDVIGGAGSTSSVYTTPPVIEDTYFIAKVTGGTCDPSYSNPVLITVNPAPEDKSVTAEETQICPGSSTHVILHSSQTGVVYQLRNDDEDVNIGDLVSGTGSDIELETGILNTTTTFNVLATNGDCSSEMADQPIVTVDDNLPPTLIPTILPPTTSFTSGGWTSDFSSINVNNTGNTYALVAPGATVNLKFNWNMHYTGSYCPGCITQHYVTLQASSFNRCNESWSGGNGNKDYTFNAPTTPGVYYISLASSWWYSCNQFYTMYGPNAADNALGYIVVGTNTACPLSIVKNTDPGLCTTTISKGIDVVPLDNCGTPSLTYTLTGATEGSGLGSLSTYTFNKGVTTVSYLVTDVSNNSFNCSFTVTVNDNQAPVVPNNGNTTVQCVAAATAPEIPVATDNCDGTVNGVLVSTTDNLNSLTCQGTRIYRYSYTDAATNVSYWTFTYNIVRTTPPAETDTPVATSATVECIAGVVTPSLPVVKDVCGVTLDAPQPVVTDNYNPLICGGTREYKYTYADCAGLKFEWVFTYTIEDKTPPEMACKSETVMLGLDGNASIVAADVDNGSADNCGGALNLELNKTSFTCADRPSTMVTLKGTDCAGNTATCNATVNVDLRPTSLVYSGDLHVSYSDQVNLKATLKDATSDTPLANKTITFTIGLQSATAVTDASGVATATLIITQAPGSYSVVTSYAEECPFAAGTVTDDFRIGVERACANYTGVLMASTGSVNSSVANVLLAFTITQESDGFPGDIRNAYVMFYQSSSTSIEPISPLIPVGLVDPNDKSFGTAVFEWKYNLGTLQSNTVSVFAVVTGGYFRNNPACFGLTPITIYKPGTEFIAGGGYLMLEKPSGTIQADVPSKNNFGFNVKYNKKGTNLQGNINTIVRKTILNTATGEYELHDYQVKGNVLSSLTVGTTIAGVTPAVFTGKANLQDVTDPLNPVSIDGNFVLKVTMTDKGEPGSSDMISITVFDKTGGIWFTSRWENKKTVEQLLAGGNLVIQTGNNKSAEIFTEIAITPDIETILKVYPNPFSETLYFEFVSPTNADALLDVLDATGRKVKTIFVGPVEGGVLNTAEFVPATSVTGLYIYRLTMDKKVFVGKVIYKE